MDKITEKEARRPDAFIQTINSINAKVQPNKKALIGLAVVILIAAAGWGSWDVYNSRHEAQAQEALFIATHQVEKKEQEMAEADAKAKGGDVDKNGKKKTKAAPPAETLEARPKNLDADFGSALKSLQSVVNSFPGTRASWVAGLEIARIYQDYGQIDPGLQALQKIEIGNKAGDLLAASVQLRLGDLLQIKGQCDQAITKWNLISGPQGFSPLKPEALLRTGLCYENLKKYDEAKATYEKMAGDKDVSESRAGREGKKFLKLLQSNRRTS